MRRPSPALVIACIALFVALGGTGYAALKLPKNSVGGKQIKKNAVTSSKVKNRSLKAGDFRAGALPRGPEGPKGDKGDKGDQGNAGPGAQWALVGADGTIIDSSGGISLTARTGAGFYLNFGEPVTGRGVIGTGAYDGGETTYLTASPCGGEAGGNPVSTQCVVEGTNNANHLYVQTRVSGGSGEARAFYVAVLR